MCRGADARASAFLRFNRKEEKRSRKKITIQTDENEKIIHEKEMPVV